jgi:predicted GIY-YIG superfamily endonuclease
MKTIYVLLDENKICYIGKTEASDLNQKLNQHLDEAKHDPEKFEWIRKMFLEGRKPELIPIFTYSKKDEAYYEKLFISHYRFFLGLKLTNNLFKNPGYMKS